MGTGKKVVGFGELLLRLGTHQFQRFTQARDFEAYYTGAEANTCVSLVNYGFEGYVVSKVPANDIGQACINFLKGHGLNTDCIVRGGDRLGLFYLETGASQRPSKIIYDRANSAITTLKKGEIDWNTVLQGKDWLHFSGTAPALGPDMPEVVEEACQIAKQMGVTVSCDLNYRKKLWSPEKAQRVMTGLMAYVDVLLCNEEDAEMVFGIKAEGVDVRSGRLEADQYEDVARQVRQAVRLQIRRYHAAREPVGDVQQLVGRPIRRRATVPQPQLQHVRGGSRRWRRFVRRRPDLWPAGRDAPARRHRVRRGGLLPEALDPRRLQSGFPGGSQGAHGRRCVGQSSTIEKGKKT